MRSKKSKILFLDIDGPMIPGRAYTMPGQTKPVVEKFDPVAVGLVNYLCEYRDWKLVLHSSWITLFGANESVQHCISEGINQNYFHKHPHCDPELHWRYDRVAKWLEEHPDTTHYAILDDEPYATGDLVHPKGMINHLVLVEFRDGILNDTLNQLTGGDFRV